MRLLVFECELYDCRRATSRVVVVDSLDDAVVGGSCAFADDVDATVWAMAVSRGGRDGTFEVLEGGGALADDVVPAPLPLDAPLAPSASF